MKSVMIFIIAMMIIIGVGGKVGAAEYTVVVPSEMEPVLSDEAGESRTNAEVVQKIIDNFLSERAGHYNSPKERLERLSASDKAQIPPSIRRTLGID